MAKKKVLTKEETRRIMDRVALSGAALGPSGLREAQYYEIIKVITARHGGECLSRRYINQFTLMDFRCGKGHTFSALPLNVIHGHWCRKCGLAKRSVATKKTMVEKLRLMAQYHGGNILFTEKEYKGSKSPVTFQCKYGHKWKTPPTQILQGHWCPDCKDEAYSVKRRTSGLERMQKELKKRGWVFVSPKYKMLKDVYTFMCKKGHKFSTTGNNLVHQLTDCPVCKKLKRREAAEAKKRLAR